MTNGSASPLVADGLDAILRGEEVPWSALDVTATALLEACVERELSELVYQRLTQFQRVRDWPDEVRQELARTAHAAAATELVRGREIASVLDVLASNGVHPILLKGVPLAYAFYDSPGSRAHADTDLLVRREQIETVRRTMTDLGYGEPPSSDGELLFCQFQMVKQDRFGVNHAFDFHWRISTQSVFADVLTYDELAAATVSVSALGSHAYAAGRVHALLLACIHPVMHHRNTERLIWLYDIHLLVSRLSEAELERFAALAIDKRVAAICAHQLLLTRSRFHTSVPDRVMAKLARRRVAEPSAIYLRPSRRWHHELISSLRDLRRWRDRLRLLREVIVPSPRYMMEAYRVGALGLFLLPALYVHRVVYGAWKVVLGRK